MELTASDVKELFCIKRSISLPSERKNNLYHIKKAIKVKLNPAITEARTFLICNSSFNGDKFSEFILSHKLTKRAILIYLVPISSSIKPPCNQKMIFTSRFIRPMRNFVFLSITAMFREKFCAWYQTKGDDLVYHLGRAHAWVDTQSYKNDLIWFPYLVDALNRNAKIC